MYIFLYACGKLFHLSSSLNAWILFTTKAFKPKSFSLLFSFYIIRKQVEFKGISGQIEFKEGQRNTFKLDLIKLKQNFFVKCGEWSGTGLNITDYDSLFEGNQMNTTWAFPHIFSNTFEDFLIKIFLLFILSQSCSCYNFTGPICHDSHSKKYNGKCTVSEAKLVRQTYTNR